MTETQYFFVFLKQKIYNLGKLFQLFSEDFRAYIILFLEQSVESSGAWQRTCLSYFLYGHLRMIFQ